ncbi:MAG: hypothetical protein ABR574_03620 [Cryomorphaceae bacterium]|nr:hypothetical protein [Flavobacteriales bacterium]
MKLILTSLAIMAGVALCLGQKGNTFPGIETEKLDGSTVRFPGHVSGGFALVGIGMSKKAEEELRTWQTPVYNKFVAKTGLMDDMYDVDIAFMPIFTGASKVAKNKVVKKLQENNESLVYNYLYIYSGAREPFYDLGIDSKKEPFFLLLNAESEVVWFATGKFRRLYFEEIEGILTQ